MTTATRNNTNVEQVVFDAYKRKGGHRRKYVTPNKVSSRSSRALPAALLYLGLLGSPTSTHLRVRAAAPSTAPAASRRNVGDISWSS